MFIYVLACDNDKYYVGKTKDYKFRFEQHCSNKGSVWTRLHKPIKILKIYPCRDCFDEDKYTKMYMAIYGIDNVRGGTYNQVIINKNIKAFIEKEFITAQDRCYKCNELGHFVNKCPMRYIPSTKHRISMRPWYFAMIAAAATCTLLYHIHPYIW